MEELPCKIWNKIEDVEKEATIRVSSDDSSELVVTTVGGASWQAQAGNPLASLNLIREQIEPQGLYLLCCGSRLDVSASGMARGSRATRKVYRLELGKQAMRENMVDIFDPTEKENVATLQDQREFYQQWAASLG